MKQAQSTDAIPKIPGAHVGIVKSKWHPQYVDLMAAKAHQVLNEAKAIVDVHTLPGCLEIPLACKHLIMNPGSRYDAIICLGIILKGQTFHAEMITNECMRGLGQVMLETNTPILVEILPVLDLEQAKARAADDEYNKGIEAGLAAAEIIHWRREVAKKNAA